MEDKEVQQRILDTVEKITDTTGKKSKRRKSKTTGTSFANQEEPVDLQQPSNMANLARIETLDQAREFIAGYGVTLTGEHTTAWSQMDHNLNFSSYVTRGTQSNDSKQITVIMAEMLEDCMRKAAPQAHQTLALSNKFLEKCSLFMTSTNESVMKLKTTYAEYLPAGSKTESPTILETYRKACADFRANIHEYAYAFPTQQTSVETVIEPGVFANDLKFILQSMIGKRNMMVGGTGGGGNEHVTAILNAFTDEGLPNFPFTPLKRRKGGELKGGYDGTWKEDLTPLLLTTAILSQKNSNGGISSIQTTITEMLENVLNEEAASDYEIELKRAFTFALQECQHDYGQGQAGAGFYSQIANADVLFDTFFFLFGMCTFTIGNLRAFQPTLFLIFSKLRSNTVLNRMLGEFRTRSGVPKVVSLLSKSTHVHLPPWIMTAKRLYEMASIICPFSLKNIGGSIRSPAMSVRYISNYRDLNQYMFSFLVALHNLEASAYEKEGQSILFNISQAEYLLHQALLGRVHGFSNTQKITGNALNVQII